MKKCKPPALQTSPANTLKITAEPGKSEAQQLAEVEVRGVMLATNVLTTYSRDVFKDAASITDAYQELDRLSNAASAGDLAHAERLLSAQMLALNSMFAGLAQRAKTNSQAGYLNASDTYLRLALRAQSQCRQTAMTLFEMKNPRPIAFVQQANIAAGPQQVINATNTRVGASALAEQKAWPPNELFAAGSS